MPIFKRLNSTKGEQSLTPTGFLDAACELKARVTLNLI